MGMVTGLRTEFEGVQTGDHRLNQRVLRMVEKMAARPDAPYPELFDAAELQAAYRLFGHKGVTPEQLLTPHYAATRQRATVHPLVLVMHDSSNITHGRAGPGRDFYALGTGVYGYQSHVSLLATPQRLPLGIGHLMCLDRGQAATDKESVRWLAAVRATAQRFEGLPLVHVMDSEAGFYELLAPLLREGHRFIIRGDVRNVEVRTTRWETRCLLEVLHLQPVRLRRTVELSARTASDHKSKRNASRTARTASLSIRAGRVTLPRPKAVPGTGVRGQPRRIELNVVLVEEEQPPVGEPAVCWVLLTSEPIETDAQIEAVVDGYRARWLIEELFKALKTGCGFERRQLEYQHTSQNALALTLPLAWQLLLLRAVERQHPTAPAATLLGEALPVLRAIAKRRLPPKPTVAHALTAIAELGGHKKSNGPVGWLVLARGMKRLKEAVEIAHRLRAAARAQELDL